MRVMRITRPTDAPLMFNVLKRLLFNRMKDITNTRRNILNLIRMFRIRQWVLCHENSELIRELRSKQWVICPHHCIYNLKLHIYVAF